MHAQLYTIKSRIRQDRLCAIYSFQGSIYRLHAWKSRGEAATLAQLFVWQDNFWTRRQIIIPWLHAENCLPKQNNYLSTNTIVSTNNYCNYDPIVTILFSDMNKYYCDDRNIITNSIFRHEHILMRPKNNYLYI